MVTAIAGEELDYCSEQEPASSAEQYRPCDQDGSRTDPRLQGEKTPYSTYHTLSSVFDAPNGFG